MKYLAVISLAETCKMLKVFYFKVTTLNNKRHRYPTLLCYNTHSDPHVTLKQTMNGSNLGKPMKEVSNENDGEHVKVEVAYLRLFENEDFARNKH